MSTQAKPISVRPVEGTGCLAWEGRIARQKPGSPGPSPVFYDAKGDPVSARNRAFERWFGVTLPRRSKLRCWCADVGAPYLGKLCVSPMHNWIASPRRILRDMAGGDGRAYEALCERLRAAMALMRADVSDGRASGLRIDYTALSAAWVPKEAVAEYATRVGASRLLVVAAMSELMRDSWRRWKWPRSKKTP